MPELDDFFTLTFGLSTVAPSTTIGGNSSTDWADAISIPAVIETAMPPTTRHIVRRDIGADRTQYDTQTPVTIDGREPVQTHHERIQTHAIIVRPRDCTAAIEIAMQVSVCQRVLWTQGMPDVAPNRLHISRHYGLIRSTERPARRMGDLCRQVSWLAARASLSGLPGVPRRSASDIIGEGLAAYSCGSSLGFDLAPGSAASHRVPFSLAPSLRAV